MKNEKNINKAESNSKMLKLNLDEIELTVIDDEKNETTENKTVSPFDGLTLDDITFSSMENKDTKQENESGAKSIRNRECTVTEQNLEKQKQREEFIKKMEEEIDKVFDKLLEEINNIGDTENN